ELVERVRGKVWMMDIDPSELREVKERYTFTGVYRTAEGMKIRLLADELNDPRARPDEPTLEDGYIGEVERARALAAEV
ncbi:MAG: ABC transporter ATP-binding protein, partial [Armatimonadetes bacterium]|nr:ABC transporter ATP-binding protein [Armatimonadota bacterium]